MKIEFDKDKVQEVEIGSVAANPWNPKVEGTTEYTKVVQSIKNKGLRLPVIVRQKGEGQYEIVDGEQRWRACRELEFETILIYNMGEVCDKEAKELTIYFQQQVPFDNQNLVDLLTNMKTEFGDIDVPYNQAEIDILLFQNITPTLGETDPFEEWNKSNMPEFSATSMDFKSIVIHFQNQKDIDDFFQLINQEYKETIKYIWYPKKERDILKDKQWEEY